MNITNLKELRSEHFKEAFGLSFFKKIKGYFDSSLKDKTLNFHSGVQKALNGHFSIEEPNESAISKLSKSSVSISDDSINGFINSNLLLAVEEVIKYEKLLGSQNPDKNLNLVQTALDLTAFRIVLALGVNTEAEENLMKRGQDIIDFYKDRINILLKKNKGKDALPQTLEDNYDFEPLGKSLITTSYPWRGNV